MTIHRVRAVNTATDSENKIHDDRVAASYGFRGGLVPGVTVYGYMTLPVLEHFGETWLEYGSMSVRFREPVYDGDEICIQGGCVEDGRFEVLVQGDRATGIAWIDRLASLPGVDTYATQPMPPSDLRPAASYESLATGVVLGTLNTTLDLAASGISAPLAAALGNRRMAHPAVLLSLANQILLQNVALGPWIHAGSDVTNFSAARDGEVLEVRGKVSAQFERKGHEFVVLDIVTATSERLVQHVRHTAIWRPRPMEATA
jgi:hypothetical protein